MEKLDEYLSHVPVSADKLRALGFFDAPASKGHHLAVKGGLATHSVNTTAWLLKLTEAMSVKWPRPESPYIVGMLHDLVKCKCYEFKEVKNERAWGVDITTGISHTQPAYGISHTQPAYGISYTQPAYPGHGVASALIIASELGLVLHPAEQAAIVHHMGAFNLSGDTLKELDAALNLYPREIIATHTADMLAARVDEAAAVETAESATKENDK